MHAHHKITTLILIASTLMGAKIVGAQEMVEWPSRGQDYVQAGGVSLDDAVQMAQSRFNAKVVKAETVRNGDRRVHQIRLINGQNKVWTVRVDAETGQMF
jgi:uncharacterized membrane protein YkoI